MAQYGMYPPRGTAFVPTGGSTGRMDQEFELKPTNYGRAPPTFIGPPLGQEESLLPPPPPGYQQDGWTSVRIFGWSLYALAQLLVAALAIVSFILLMVYLPQIRSELQHARHHIKLLNACCNQSTTNINSMNQTLNTVVGDIITIEGDVTNIFNNLTSIDSEIAVLEECCANNTAAIQTLNTELYQLDLRVGFSEADIDVLTQSVGDLQLQIDNL